MRMTPLSLMEGRMYLMNQRDLAEIKRRLNLEHHNITCIRGCYVNKQGEIISSFSRSLEGMPQEEAEKYLALFRRALSGTQGQNLLDVEFTPQQVMDSPEHRPRGQGGRGNEHGSVPLCAVLRMPGEADQAHLAL